MAVDAAGKPVRFIVTSGTTADCTQTKDLIKYTRAKYLLAARGYDTNEINYRNGARLRNSAQEKHKNIA